MKTKKAVRQVAKSELHRLAQEAHLPIELLPAKMVHTRKAGSGAYRSRAVVCGNYEHVGEDDRYAGGADGNQIRAQVRLASSKRWAVCGTDIRVAFLNAPKRDETKITAMEVPTVFRKLGLAGSDDVWIIQKAVYGLTSSPRDWCLYRDETLPTMSWRRHREGHEVEGRFVRTPDDNVWRLEEADQITGEKLWTGLMTVYVDDLLVTAEDEAATAAISAIAKVWAISEVEKAGVQTRVKYCGFEIEVPHDQDGYILHQRKYEKEMTQRWDIHKAIDVPNFKLSDAEEEPADPIDQNQIKTAQAMAGALLWLNTRTRPDISVGVSMVCRLATKTLPNPLKLERPSWNTSRATLVDFATSAMRQVRCGVKEGNSKLPEVPNCWKCFLTSAMAQHLVAGVFRGLRFSLVVASSAGRLLFNLLSPIPLLKVNWWATAMR